MRNALFRTVTGTAAVYHLLLGAALLVLPGAAMGKVIQVALGTPLEIDPSLSMIAKFTSVYVVAFGMMLAFLCVNPTRYRVLVIPALFLFGVRLVNKLVFMTTIEETFGVTRGRSLFAIASLAVIFGLMAWTMPRRSQSPST